ncbi:LuxR family transcriptional regulator, partial [Burkholderia pseudomallei]
MLSAALPASRDVRTLVETFRQAALQIGSQHHAIVELSGASPPASIDVVSLHSPSAWVEHYTR